MEKTLRKNKLILLYLIIFICGCKNSSEKNHKNETETLIEKDTLKEGWHNTYKEGKLIKSEVINVKGEKFVNQKIEYFKNQQIDSTNSKFFHIVLPDTLKIGVNMGIAELYTFNKLFSSRASSVIVENTYPNNITKKDTFFGNHNHLKFGVFVSKVGKHNINGKISELIMTSDEKGNGYKIKITSYFEKRVFVRDTI